MRNGYPPGVTCWVDTSHPDPEAAAAFYADIFGWSVKDAMPAGSPEPYFVATLDGMQVGAIGGLPAGDASPAAWNTYVRVASADASAAAAVVAGGSVTAGPFDVGEAGRMAVVRDPEGAEIRLWEPGTNQGAELVNAPGSWNFSDLHTRDAAGAKAFYGRVFGWEFSDVEGMNMVMVPGYGDAQEAAAPGFKERQAGTGAPPGFADCIAWLVPAGDAGPHWHVSFSVADADAAAARTKELGGEIVVEPHDVPWLRTAVLRDPQGAAFTVGRFTPPQ